MTVFRPAPLHGMSRRSSPGSGGRGGVLAAHLRAVRPGFLLASMLPVLIGSAWGASVSGTPDLGTALLFLVGMVCGHSAGNILNDVCDDMTGNDPSNVERITPFTGGSRVIQDGRLTQGYMTGLVVAFLTACAVTGVWLVSWHGWPVLVFGLTMGAMVLAHHVPPVKLNHRGLAEVFIGLMFGIGPVVMASWLQGGRGLIEPLLVSLPVAAWVVNILMVNEIPDRRADARVNKKTLVVLLGVRPSMLVQAGLDVLALLAIGALVIRGGLPVWAAVAPGVLTVIHGVMLARADPDDRAALLNAIRATLALHTGGGLSLLLGIIMAP